MVLNDRGVLVVLNFVFEPQGAILYPSSADYVA